MDSLAGLDVSEATRQAISAQKPQTVEAAISLAIRHADEDRLDRDISLLGTRLKSHESAPRTADSWRVGEHSVGEYADATGNQRVEIRSASEPIISAWRSDLLQADPDPVSLRLRGRSPFSVDELVATDDWLDFLRGGLAHVGGLWKTPPAPHAEQSLERQRTTVALSELADVLSNKLGIRSTVELQQRCRENGCTLTPDFDFVDCCNRHDLCYCQGCTEADRELCDERLRVCIRQTGHPTLAEIYFRGVRVFGRHFFSYC